MTLKDLIWEEFLDYLKVERNYKDNPNNILAVKQRFDPLKLYFAATEFNRENFRHFLNTLKAKGNAPSTLNKYITVARRIEDFLDLNLNLKRFAYRPEKPADFDALTVEETEAIATYKMPYGKSSDFLNLRNQILYLLPGINGGNRIGEALNLKWEDVHEAPRPHVIFKDTKSRKDRKVYLAPRLWDLIQKLPRTSPYVFTSYRGSWKPLDDHHVNSDLRNRAFACDIDKDVHYHLLRHTYATEMSENPEISAFDIADIMGYKDPKTILERYKKSNLSHMSEVVMSHPALRGDKTPHMIGEQLVKAVLRLVDFLKFPLRIAIEDGMLTIQVKGLTVGETYLREFEDKKNSK